MRKLYPILFLLLVVVLAFWKVIFQGEFTLLNGSDLAAAYYPWFDVAAYWLKQGVFMLWDPYVYSGKANMGEPQVGLYYPLNWLLLLLPARGGGVNLDGMQALLILDYLLAAVFSYLLARSYELTPHAAVMAGISYSLAGFVPQLYGYVNILGGFVWMPLVLLAFRRCLDAPSLRARFRWIALSGLFLALCFLPGHHIPLIQAGLLLLFYAAYRILTEWKTASWHHRARVAGSLLGVPVTAALLTAHQWIPSMEWAQRVYRWIGEGPPVSWGEKVPYSALQVAGNLHPQDAFSLVFPYISTSNNLYSGAFVLFFALTGLLFVRRREATFFAIGAFVYFFSSWGEFSALHGWVNTFIPGVWFAREVFHYLTPFQLCIAMLAGFGFDALVRAYAAEEQSPVREFARRAAGAMAVIVLLLAIVIGVLHIGQSLPIEHVYLRGAGGLAAYTAVLGILIFMAHTGRARPETFRAFVIAARVLDLSSHISDDAPMKNPPPGRESSYVRNVWRKPPSAEFLVRKRDESEDRFRVDDMPGIYPPNFGDAWRIDSTMGHGATALTEYFRFRETGWGPASNASAMLNARYFLSKIPVSWAPRPSEESGELYENPRAVPRAFLARRLRAFRDDESMLAYLGSPLLNPRDTVLLFENELRSLPESIRTGFASDDGRVQVRVQSLQFAAEENEEGATDPGDRRTQIHFKRPWGWSAGDEIALEARSVAGEEQVFLEVFYFPTVREESRLAMESVRLRESRSVVLPGLAEGEKPFSLLHSTCLAIGVIGSEGVEMRLQNPAESTARIDSVRVTGKCGGGSPGAVAIKLYEPNRVKIWAEVREPSVLVLSDVYYPGWEARVNGVETPLMRGNFIMRAVPLLPGRHEIAFEFRSASLRWGAGISLFSIIGLAALGLFTAARRLPGA
jgi:hypothetical protein